MLFNAGAPISDLFLEFFVGILPKVPFLLFFKAIASFSLSISLTSVLEKLKSWFTEIYA